MEFRIKKVILIGFLINLIILLINFVIFKKFEINFNRTVRTNRTNVCNSIEIWSKASIGDYFWEHILKAKIQKNLRNGYYRFGKKYEHNLTFKFRSGYSITPKVLKEFLDEKLFNQQQRINLILILNGRTKQNVQIAESYLNQFYQFKNQLNLGIVLLGNENCFNNWIKRYLDDDLIKFLFVVYDWNQIDNVRIFQWPLGVATYRNFTQIAINKELVKNERKYLCNYVATVYKNSSREELLNLIESNNELKSRCIVNAREKWLPNETDDSLADYELALRNSDLTLSPLGMNHECYRIYEAFSYLSEPILEENLNHVHDKRSNCDQKSAYRLLKEFNAPVRFVSNWTEDFNQILQAELKLTSEDRLNRRIKLFDWYEKFKDSMRSRLIDVLKDKFNCSD